MYQCSIISVIDKSNDLRKSAPYSLTPSLADLFLPLFPVDNLGKTKRTPAKIYDATILQSFRQRLHSSIRKT